MKLELDIQSTPSQSVSQTSVNSNGFENNSSEEVKKLLRAGINAAKEGNRAEARLMLLQATEAEPANETAWLWLASISEYPEELLVFLQNVLKINPENERALEWSHQTKSLLSKTFVQRGIDASHQSQKDFAKQCFLQAIVHDEKNEMAWLWLASSTESVEEKCSHLQKVLNINPENETALSSMKSVKNQLAQPLLKKANSAAISGDHESARQLLEEVMKYSPELEEAWILKAYLAQDFYEKISCYEKALEINPQHDAAQAGLASLKALAPKAEAKLPEPPAQIEEKAEVVEVVEEKVETVEEEAFTEPENILETPHSELAEIAHEDSELLSEVFDAPTGELDEVFTQEAEESFSQSKEEVVEEFEASVVEETVVELAEENQAVQNEAVAVAEESQVEVVEESVQEVEVPATEESAEPVAVAENQVEETQWKLVSEEETEPSLIEETSETLESVEEFSQNVQPEVEENSEVSDEVPAEPVESAATPVFQSENHAAETTDSFEVEEKPIEESQQSFVEHLRYYQPEAESPETAEVEEMQNEAELQVVEVQSEPTEVAETVAYQPEYPSSNNGVGTFNQPENYADYQQPTVEFSYQNVPSPYTDPSAETLTSYSPQETVAAQSDYIESSVVEEQGADVVEESPAVEPQAATVEEVPTPTFSVADHHAEPVFCPFCYSQNEPLSVTCVFCEAMLSLSDLEMLLAHQTANQEVMLQAIEKMEVEKTIRAFDVDELTNLAVAHLNAHNLRKGFAYLQEASQINPNDVVLSSKVNFLAIRLNEIEEYDQKAQDNPVQSKTIMVVDDSPTVRKLITGKLEKCGHSVVSAVDGMDALAKINEVIPDLVLLDITMPRLDGYQVCKLIRNNEITKDIPVVMISGKDGFFDKVRGRMAGSTGYITKPFGPDTLMKTIETYLA